MELAAKASPEFFKKTSVTDSVEHPSHYNQGAIETIDYLESTLTDSEIQGFMKGNIIKYVSRERNKNGLEDLKKAQWYLDRLIEYVEKDSYTS